MSWKLTSVLILSLILANLPFFTHRIGGVLKTRQKSVVIHLVEMAGGYFLVGFYAYLLEKKLGNVHWQSWEFYVTTSCFFMICAFPGFTLQYLWKAGLSKN